MARFDKPLPYRYLQAPFSAGALTAAGSSSSGERASARLSEASNGVSELLTARRKVPMAYQSFRWPVGSLDGPLEGSDGRSEAWIRCRNLPMAHWKLGYAVGSFRRPYFTSPRRMSFPKRTKYSPPEQAGTARATRR